MDKPEQILQKYKSPDLNLEDLTRDLWLVLEFFPMASVNAMIIHCKNAKYIAVNSLISENDQRFAIAHEIGHYLYWDAWFTTSMLAKYDFREKRADDFARKLLMPECYVMECLENGYSSYEIADSIWVPVRELEIRIKEVAF